jgi:DNA-binding SARP family transcriptional activator/TolB-like protein
MTALLGYLALSEDYTATRDRLVGLLWSEATEGNARTSLRQVLHWLRHLFDMSGYSGLYTDKTKVALSPDLIWVDVWAALKAAENQIVHRELLGTEYFCDRLLEGFEDVDPAFRIWLLARRQNFRDRLLRALEEILADQGALDGRGTQAAEALVKLDPTHEEAVRYLMRARAATGNIGTALRHYKSLWDILDDEYAMEPSIETQRLVSDIKIGVFDEVDATAGPEPPLSTSPAWIPTPTTAQHRLVLAIEPFSTEDIAIDNRHLLQGFRHFLMASFVRFREWRVMDLLEPLSNGSSQGANFAIQATVLTSGRVTNIVLTLKDLRSDIFVWSDRFELRVEAWMTLQQHVVRSVTTALNVHLSADRMTRLAETSTISSQLYDTWLRGQAMISRLEPEDWRQASELFEDVIRQAPEFAPAYSSLVQLKNSQHIVYPGVFRSMSRQADALALAQTAARLDPIDSRTQLCLAWAFAFDEQYENAELHFDLARGLNELDPWTLMSTAQGFAFLADGEKASKLADDAMNNVVQPRPLHWGYLAGIRFFLGEYEVALDAAVRAGDFLPNNGAWRAASLVRLGDRDGARQEADRCLRLIRKLWRGDKDPSDGEITRWVLQLFPIRHRAHQETLRRSLRDAGFPVSSK